MPTIVDLSDLVKRKIEATSICIFGGTFDPIHIGHCTIIRSLSPIFHKFVIAPTFSNPWKDKPLAITDRLEMIRLVMQAENFSFSESRLEKLVKGINLIDFNYNFSFELVDGLKSYGYQDIYWAIGEDSRQSVMYWKNFEQLNIKIIVCPVIIKTHSTSHRENQDLIHPAIHNFVIKHKFYR